MASKTYTTEDEEFVRFVRTTHTLKETADISGLSENIVKRILYSNSSNKVLELESELKKILFEQKNIIDEQKVLIDTQAKAIDKLNKHVFKRDSYEEEQPVTRLILGRKTNE